MSDSQPIKVMIVDDHPVVRIGMKAIINQQKDMAVVAEAKDGPSAVERFGEIQPEVVLMDLRLPGKNGIESTAAILARFRVCDEKVTLVKRRV